MQGAKGHQHLSTVGGGQDLAYHLVPGHLAETAKRAACHINVLEGLPEMTLRRPLQGQAWQHAPFPTHSNLEDPGQAPCPGSSEALSRES